MTRINKDVSVGGGFDEVIGQSIAKRILMDDFKSRSLAHTYLFSGGPGVGKTTMARAFIRLVNCMGGEWGEGYAEVGTPALLDDDTPFRQSMGSCGVCLSCKKVASDTHPDVVWVEPQGRFIKVDQVRAVEERIHLRIFEARHRFVVIKKADQLNLVAQNALLKLLEEPPTNTHFILTATHRERLAPTILSRCRKVPFKPLALEELKRVIQRHQTDSDIDWAQLDQPWLYTLAQGSVTYTLDLIDSGLLEARDLLIRVMFQVLDDPSEVESAAKLLTFKESLPQLLGVWFLLLRDIIVLQMGGAQNAIANSDVTRYLVPLSQRLSVGSVHLWSDYLVTALQYHEGNVNTLLILENLLIKMKNAHDQFGKS